MTGAAPDDDRPAGERYAAGSGGGLVGGRCGACGDVVWPMPLRCPTCGADAVEGEALPATGSVETWTRVWVPLPGISSPYHIARVRLGDCRVYGRVEVGDGGELETGRRVEVRSAPPEPGALVRYWFVATGA